MCDGWPPAHLIKAIPHKTTVVCFLISHRQRRPRTGQSRNLNREEDTFWVPSQPTMEPPKTEASKDAPLCTLYASIGDGRRHPAMNHAGTQSRNMMDPSCSPGYHTRSPEKPAHPRNTKKRTPTCTHGVLTLMGVGTLMGLFAHTPSPWPSVPESSVPHR